MACTDSLHSREAFPRYRECDIVAYDFAQAWLREVFPDLPEEPDAKTVFLKLRELRNKW
jgi:hypothetical protein